MKKLITFLTTVLMSMSLCTPISAKTNHYDVDDSVKKTKNSYVYSKGTTIKKGDPHYGWELGAIVVKGYTTIEKENDGTIVFLKTSKDKMTVSYRLDQNINKLDGNKKRYIVNDVNGYDQDFGTKVDKKTKKNKTGKGKGTFLVRYKDSDHKTHLVKQYKSYLQAVQNKKANTKINLNEEGDYEVALDYEIKAQTFKNKYTSFIGGTTNYKEYFKFKVRNCNSVSFFKEIGTNTFLENGDSTTKGFQLDFANSKYIQVHVKRVVDGNVEMNEYGKDGQKYKKKGKYTLTVSNDYSGNSTYTVTVK